jgi:hypothetical protein
MGYYWQGLPPYVVEWARGLLPSDSVAVETGTFQGDTSALLARSFGSCTTIERHDELYAQAHERFLNDDRITVVHGSSRDQLAKTLPSVDVGCFFWLDAHGVYDHQGEDREENPLLAEIDTILTNRPGSMSVIAVDDARGMGTKPEWPPLTDVFARLSAGGYMVAIVDDCLVAAPASLDPDFYQLYRAGRMVEVPALFHVWAQVRKIVEFRLFTDQIVLAAQRKIRR